MATTKTVADLRREIAALERVEVHVETNQGTYGPGDAVRAIGVSDPAFANREVYETVGGTRRASGPSEDRAPGRMRAINRDRLSDLRKRLADLRAELRKAR